MRRDIVVPLDGSERDQAALGAARDLARHLGASLLLVHIEPILPSLARVVADDHRLIEYAAELTAEGFDVRYLVDFGRPDVSIAKVARDHDVIVLTPRHRRLLDALRHPSVTQGLFARTSVPLVILPDETVSQSASNLLASAENRVIVPLDGSELAEQALTPALEFASAYQRSILLVRVVPTIFIAGVGPETTRLRRQAQRAEETDASEYVARMRDRLHEEYRVEVHILLLHGEPAECLTRLAGEHPGNLLVMSTHGRGGLARAVIGSVAAEVMRRSAIPVVVIPRSSVPQDTSGEHAHPTGPGE